MRKGGMTQRGRDRKKEEGREEGREDGMRDGMGGERGGGREGEREGGRKIKSNKYSITKKVTPHLIMTPGRRSKFLSIIASNSELVLLEVPNVSI